MEQNKNTPVFDIFVKGIYESEPWYNQTWQKQKKFGMWCSDGNQYIYNEYNSDDNYTYFKSESSEIEYRFNKDGFRSNSFIDTKNKPFVLTAGCSNTFGHQLPEEMRWSNIFQNNYKKNIEVYNIGVAGLDTHRILANCYTFIEKYGTPEYMLLLLPPFYRNITIINKKKEKRITTLQTPLFIENLDIFDSIIKNNKHGMQNLLYHHVMAIHNFETFCSTNNIKLFWFTWDQILAPVYEKLKFKGLIKSSDFATLENDNVDNIKYWDWAADNNHQGYRWHKNWANTFLNKINESQT